MLVVRADGSLVAAPFDEKRLELTGRATPLLEGVRVEFRGTVDLDVSETGTLVYAPGGALDRPASDRLVWVTRGGDAEEIDPGWVGNFASPSLSPDGTAWRRRYGTTMCHRSGSSGSIVGRSRSSPSICVERVGAGGERFVLVATAGPDTDAGRLIAVENFFEELTEHVSR